MKSQIRPALTIFLLLTILTGVAYPALVTGVAQVVFPYRANGSVINRDGKAVGSELIGQTFDGPGYFWGRPSATSKDDKPFPYNAASSGGSNLGPTNPSLVNRAIDPSKLEPGKIGTLTKDEIDALGTVQKQIYDLRSADPNNTAPIPVDLVTASASGLDPHISPAAAEFQVKRVAKARGMSVDALRQVVAEHTEDRTFAVLGEARVNVLRLNLALDRAAP